ncbi:MAG: endonuclease/exonuclease/phosphatase family protein [Planctomycetales bacterium]|nr:endonuclease/exonuclease/phosphatase family protein [Planctomycetales bacterium]
MTTTFLFWNMGNQPRADVAVQLVQQHAVDVLMLTECDIDDNHLTQQLAVSTGVRFHRPWSQSTRIRIFTRMPQNQVREVQFDPSNRMTISRLIFAKTDILLAVLHLPSKVNWSDEDQREEVQRYAREIRSAERRHGHERTVLVGDLNMNPFEPGMVSSHGFHGVMTRQLAMKKTRTVQNHDYPFFYNPMWGCYGDRTDGPAGSHFFRSGKPILYFWNIFDQVLVRPDLLSVFDNDVQIIDSVGTDSLCDNLGRPDSSKGSDHFPLLFRLGL